MFIKRLFDRSRTLLENLGQTPLVREGLTLLGLYWLYSSIRWLVARDSGYEAFNNAYKIIELEKQLGIFHEPTIQSWLVNHALWLVKAANTFYTVGYFPLLILTGALLYRYCPERFHVFKLTFLLGLGLALVCFSVFPLAPPRMLPEMGLIDTQEVFSDSLYNQKTALSFYNPYAAMPSLHFGWSLLIGLMAYSFRRRILKLMGILYPSCMALVIVTTGHHYILDIVGGGIVIGSAFALVKTLPHLIQEWTPSYNSSSISSHAHYKKRPNPQPSSPHTGRSGLLRDRLKYIQRHNLRSARISMLIKRPPL